MKWGEKEDGEKIDLETLNLPKFVGKLILSGHLRTGQVFRVLREKW